MLHALRSFSTFSGLSSEPGFGPRGVHWAVHVDRRGRLTKVEDLRSGRKPCLFPNGPKLSSNELSLGGRANPRSQFLVETVKLLLSENGNPGKRAFFLDLLLQAMSSAPALETIRLFLNDAAQRKAAYQALSGQGGRPIDSMVVVVDGQNPLFSEQWKLWWRDWYGRNYAPERTADAVDVLDGRLVSPLVSHPKVSGFSQVGGLPTGDVLTSFAMPAFESYGLYRAQNAAMSILSARIVTESLQSLMGRSHLLGQTAMVAWSEPDLEDVVAPLFDRGAKVHSTGRYHLLLLSANSGRVRVRSYRQGEVVELRSRLLEWAEDLALAGRPAPTLPDIMHSLYRDGRAEMRGSHVGSLLHAILDGSPVPALLLSLAIRITPKELFRGQEPPAARLALLKASLRRCGLPAPSALDEDLADAAYLFGRLMGALARLHYAEFGDVGAGPVLRAFPLTLSSPVRGLRSLGGVFRRRSRLVGQLAHSLEGRLPDRWTREEQALLILGYAQQRWERGRDDREV